MKKKIYLLSFTMALAFALAAFISGTTPRTAAAPSSDALSALPASDIVITIDTQRLLSEALPTMLSENPGLLAKLNNHVEQFKNEMGVDLRTFDSIAVGMRFNNSPGNDFDTVVVARGHFNANEVIEASFNNARSKHEIQRLEEQYEGKTIYLISSQRRASTAPATKARVVVNPDKADRKDDAAETGGKAGVLQAGPVAGEERSESYNVKVRRSSEQVAVVALDANTIAAGELKGVRAAIDASMGRSRVDDELVRMATQNPSALVGFSGRVPATITEKMAAAKGGIESKYFASIRQFYGSFSMVGMDAETFVAVRTENAGQAHDISQALNAMKMLSGFGVARPSNGEFGSLAAALKDLSITAQDNEVQIKLNLKQKDLAPFLRHF